MKTIIATLIRSYFTPSIAQALKGLNKAQAQLEAAANLAQTNADNLDGTITRADATRYAEFVKRDQARRVAAKIADLVA